MTDASVHLWGNRVGAVSDGPDGGAAVFEYDPAFAAAGVEPAPLMMPVRGGRYSFPDLSRGSFRGLPGMLADSLPDAFGNSLIDAWLARQGRTGPMSPVERLRYTGERGMGALEFRPPEARGYAESSPIDVAALTELAARVLHDREAFSTSLSGEGDERALTDILMVGTSAGGQRPKAVIAFNEQTGEVRSGQVPADSGFEHWILKFDGVESGPMQGRGALGSPAGYGAIEYAYSMMARAAGIEMTPCRLLEEGGRRHFMTRRFDRPGPDEKLHMQSLAALRHLDFMQAGAHSYEQALLTCTELGLSHRALEQLFRRMVFNVVARNQDDHVKNIAFLMNRSGRWALAPAFDVTYSYNPTGDWTSTHQMTIAGKRDDFTLEDLKACAEVARLQRGAPRRILDEVTAVVEDWPRFAEEAGVDERRAQEIARAQRLAIG